MNANEYKKIRRQLEEQFEKKMTALNIFYGDEKATLNRDWMFKKKNKPAIDPIARAAIEGKLCEECRKKKVRKDNHGCESCSRKVCRWCRGDKDKSLCKPCEQQPR